MTEDRKENLEWYEREKSETSCIENVQLCDKIAEDSIDDSEKVYWKKKGIEIREEIWGKKDIRLGVVYDEMAELQFSCGNYKPALGWCQKSIKIKLYNQESVFSLVFTYIMMADIYYYMREYEKGIEYLQKVLTLDIIESKEKYEAIYPAYLLMIDLYDSLNNIIQRNYYINLAIKIVHEYFEENSIQMAEICVQKARVAVNNKEDKLELLKKGFIIYLDILGMEDPKSSMAYYLLWECWKTKEITNEKAMQYADEWIKKNMSTKVFNEVLDWKRRRNGY